jgi:hypothetical protein
VSAFRRTNAERRTEREHELRSRNQKRERRRRPSRAARWSINLVNRACQKKAVSVIVAAAIDAVEVFMM